MSVSSKLSICRPFVGHGRHPSKETENVKTLKTSLAGKNRLTNYLSTPEGGRALGGVADMADMADMADSYGKAGER